MTRLIDRPQSTGYHATYRRCLCSACAAETWHEWHRGHRWTCACGEVRQENVWEHEEVQCQKNVSIVMELENVRNVAEQEPALPVKAQEMRRETSDALSATELAFVRCATVAKSVISVMEQGRVSAPAVQLALI